MRGSSHSALALQLGLSSALILSKLRVVGQHTGLNQTNTVANVRVEDPIRQARAVVFSAWVEELQAGLGYQTGELIKAAELYTGTERTHPALWDALFAIAAPRSGVQTIDARLLGLWLRDNLGTISAGHKLKVNRSDRQRPRWSLER